MKLIALYAILILHLPLPLFGQRLSPPRKYQTDNDDHSELDDDEEDNNSTAKPILYRYKFYELLVHAFEDFSNHKNPTSPLQERSGCLFTLVPNCRVNIYVEKPFRYDVNNRGQYLGAPCESQCNSRLLHVYCNSFSGVCECERNYPVKLNPTTGCGKAKKLGEQCYYRESCQYTDQHSACVQVHHNAICQCEAGYHSVSIQKPSKRVFCAEDLLVMTTDFSTFAGVLFGIAVLSGLICFVLHLFNQNLYGTRRHRFGNANLAPPILFSSDPGSLPLPIIDRSLTSATSTRTLGSFTSRRASSVQGCRGIPVSASRAGSRRPSIASVHSSTSIRSYSAKRYEKEREQKEEREMQRRLTKMTSSSANSCSRIPPTPSPHSTDDLLPTLEEDKQAPPLAIQEESSNSFHDEIPSTSKQFP